MSYEISDKVQQLNGMLCEMDSIYQTLLSAKNISDAVKKVYKSVDVIKFENAHYRRDIAARALNRWTAV